MSLRSTRGGSLGGTASGQPGERYAACDFRGVYFESDVITVKYTETAGAPFASGDRVTLQKSAAAGLYYGHNRSASVDVTIESEPAIAAILAVGVPKAY